MTKRLAPETWILREGATFGEMSLIPTLLHLDEGDDAPSHDKHGAKGEGEQPNGSRPTPTPTAQRHSTVQASGPTLTTQKQWRINVWVRPRYGRAVGVRRTLRGRAWCRAAHGCVARRCAEVLCCDCSQCLDFSEVMELSREALLEVLCLAEAQPTRQVLLARTWSRCLWVGRRMPNGPRALALAGCSVWVQVIARWVRQRHIMLNLLSSSEKTLRRFMGAWKLYSTTAITLKQLYVRIGMNGTCPLYGWHDVLGIL